MERTIFKSILGLGLILLFLFPVRPDLDRNQVIITCSFILGICILINKEK